jgi:hypothetical protein
LVTCRKDQRIILSIDLADPRDSSKNHGTDLTSPLFMWTFSSIMQDSARAANFFPMIPVRNKLKLRVNVQALVALTPHFGKAMAARGKTALNSASSASFQPLSDMVAYAAIKPFVLHFSALHL